MLKLNNIKIKNNSNKYINKIILLIIIINFVLDIYL